MKTIALILSILFFFTASAQKNHLKVSGGVEVPTGDAAFFPGWSIEVADYYNVCKGGSVLLSASIVQWKSDLKGYGQDAGLFLIRPGFRQFVSNRFYVQGQAGIAIATSDWGEGSEFTFGGGVGYLFKKKGTNTGFDMFLRMNRVPNMTWIGLGLGYQFKL